MVVFTEGTMTATFVPPSLGLRRMLPAMPRCPVLLDVPGRPRAQAHKTAKELHHGRVRRAIGTVDVRTKLAPDRIDRARGHAGVDQTPLVVRRVQDRLVSQPRSQARRHTVGAPVRDVGDDRYVGGQGRPDSPLARTLAPLALRNEDP